MIFSSTTSLTTHAVGEDVVVGSADGATEGATDGTPVVGPAVGPNVGSAVVGPEVGPGVGPIDGNVDTVGAIDTVGVGVGPDVIPLPTSGTIPAYQNFAWPSFNSTFSVFPNVESMSLPSVNVKAVASNRA